MADETSWVRVRVCVYVCLEERLELAHARCIVIALVIVLMLIFCIITTTIIGVVVGVTTLMMSMWVCLYMNTLRQCDIHTYKQWGQQELFV